MAETTLNSFATNTEQLPFVLPQNSHPCSTLSSSSVVPQGGIKMNFHIDRAETGDAAFGTHLREAAGIIKDWIKNR